MFSESKRELLNQPETAMFDNTMRREQKVDYAQPGNIGNGCVSGGEEPNHKKTQPKDAPKPYFAFSKSDRLVF